MNDLHRLLPQSPDAERGVLSAFMWSPTQVAAACQDKGITSKWFFLPANAEIYEALHYLNDERLLNGDREDLIVLTQYLSDTNRLKECGGGAGLTDIQTFLPSASNFAYYAEVLLEKFVLRRIAIEAAKLEAMAYNAQDEVPATVAAFQTAAANIDQLFRWKRDPRKNRTQIIAEILGAYRNGHQEELVGKKTGLEPLDDEIGGITRGELVVLAGSWSSGKSSIALQIADRWATDYRERVAFFTFDDSEEAMIRRHIQMRAGVNLAETSQQQELDGHDHKRIAQAAEDARHSRIEFIDDIAAHPNIQAVCAASRAMHAQEPLGMVVVDYDEQIKDKQRGENDEQALANIAVASKNLAIELNCVVILLSQVTTDEKTGKVVTRGSAAKLQAAKKALLIVRGEREDRRTIKIWKNKTGKPGGSVEMGFHGKTFRFYALSPEEIAEPPNSKKTAPRR